VDARESFERGKGYLLGGIDILIVKASHIIIRAPEELRPHILSALDAAQPYITSAINISKPYYDHAMGIITPYAIQLRPYVQPYLVNLATIIQRILDKSPALTGLIALAVVEAENAIENVLLYCTPSQNAAVPDDFPTNDVVETIVCPAVVLRTEKHPIQKHAPVLRNEVDVFGVENLSTDDGKDTTELKHD